MPNTIKYSTTGDTQSIRKGNFYLGVGDVGKGPSEITKHYQGISPPSNGYTIYVNTSGNLTSIFCANNDYQLINLTNGFAGQNYTTVTQCFNWFATQSNYVCVNKNYEGIITNGLVFNLDAGFIPSYPTNGTTWYDLSYNVTNSTLTNGPTYTSLDGGSIVFDGVDDYVSIPDINFTTATIDIWVYISAYSAGGAVFIYQSSNGFEIWAGTDNVIRYNKNPNTGLTSGPGFTLNAWNNIVATSDGTVNKLYFNNTNIGSTNGGIFDNTSGDIRISGYGGYMVNGRCSVLKMYNRALTTSEITQNYNAGLSRFNTSNIVKDNLILDLNASNSVSYPTTGTEWRDLSGYGNKGTLINGPTFDTTTKSFLFDGSDDYVNIPYNENLNTPNGATYEILIKPISSGEFINRGTSDATDNPRMYIYNTGMLYFDWSSSGVDRYSQSNVGAAPLNSWSHIIFIATPGDQLRIYVNGQQTSYSVASASMPSPLPNTINPIQIGRVDWIPRYFNGNIGLVRLYNRSLSASEILQNYYGAPIITDGLILALDAKNIVSYPGSGTTWYDLTGNGAHGTLINGVSWNPNGWFEFDGTNDGIDGINVPQNYVDLMIGMYSEGGSGSGIEMVFAKYNDADKSFRTANGIFRHSGIDFNDWNYENTQYDYINGEFISGNVDLNNNWKIVRTVNQNSTFSPPFVYSISSDFYDRRYKGRIAFILCYNRVLTDDEVNQNYNATKSRFGL